MTDVDRAYQPPQLTLDFPQHPDLDEGSPIFGSMKLNLDVGIRRDLNRGDRVTYVIATLDGEVLASGQAAVKAAGAVDIEEKGVIVATERKHVAKVI